MLTNSRGVKWSIILLVTFFMGSAMQLFSQTGISGIGSFEGELPSYWTKGVEPSGATLEWATDQSRSMGKSLKITKSATDEAAMWTSENMADFWSPVHNKDQDIFVGAYVRTQGVNTNPASDDAKWYISYTFYDSSGALIGETRMDIDQSSASSGSWMADTNDVGQTILPKDSWKTIIKFVGGKDATGTVWADDFMLYGRTGWAGQNWNTAVGVPSGWYYWLPPGGGNNGELSHGYENTIVTTEEAYTGLKSLKFDLPFDRPPQDAFVGTNRMLLDGSDGNLNSTSIGNEMDISALSVNLGDRIRISVWIKANNLVPDSAAMYPTTWAVGFTYGFFKGNGNNDGWNSVDGYPKDMQFVFPNVTSFDWTQYYIDIDVPDNADAKTIAIRLHPYSRFTGTIYFDDLMIEVIGVTDVEPGSQLPDVFAVHQNYPNPFNPSTTISYTIPKTSKVSVKVFDILGREVVSLLDEVQVRGAYDVVWNGKNNFGEIVGSGIYFYRVETEKFAQVMKMILLK
ncbi:MAG: T9SS type A sorting domain-containing protein [Melioribacteraceae bacterium]|nr:T9SS type A sorting domain-containing protein [Melioribacteraceae bacterium]